MTLEICIYIASIISWVAFNWIAGEHESEQRKVEHRRFVIFLGGAAFLVLSSVGIAIRIIINECNF